MFDVNCMAPPQLLLAGCANKIAGKKRNKKILNKVRAVEMDFMDGSAFKGFGLQVSIK